MHKIDILLPIYNSYDETKQCIDSILSHTQRLEFNLYLLDDNSTDNRIKELTSFYSEKYSNIFSVRNEKNLGFPGNVNNGIRITKNDVVILNSDTLVTDSWLKILNEVAYSKEDIAAVNPMSNYGLISAIPTNNARINDLFSYEEIYNAFQKCKVTGYDEVPLLIGFCIYIKRNALENVGVLDADTFKRGYGEETDWCKRARNMGYKLVVAKEAYVHHIGGSSFGIEKENLRTQSKKILVTRYPEIESEIEQFVKKNQFKIIRKCIINELNYHRKNASLLLKIKMLKHYFINR